MKALLHLKPKLLIRTTLIWMQRLLKSSTKRVLVGLFGLVLFSLATSDDDGSGAQNEHDASHVEDGGTDAAGGGKQSTFLVLNAIVGISCLVLECSTLVFCKSTICSKTVQTLRRKTKMSVQFTSTIT